MSVVRQDVAATERQAGFSWSKPNPLRLFSVKTTRSLFPYLRSVREADRATEFRQRCRGLKIEGVTLQSYRYAWAERAKACGYPECFAQIALGHNSKAVHRAYARNAAVTIPPLEEFERRNQSHINQIKSKIKRS